MAHFLYSMVFVIGHCISCHEMGIIVAPAEYSSVNTLVRWDDWCMATYRLRWLQIWHQVHSLRLKECNVEHHPEILLRLSRYRPAGRNCKSWLYPSLLPVRPDFCASQIWFLSKLIYSAIQQDRLYRIDPKKSSLQGVSPTTIMAITAVCGDTRITLPVT